jgi:SAM-dependent methyltransferase
MAKKKLKDIKIDLGCGTKKKEGFIGIDSIAFKGVDYILKIGTELLPFDDESVSEVYASHFVEHLTAGERIFLFNDLYRVMKPGATATIIVPYWGSSRAYGDPTHQWPPIGEYFFSYLNKGWRDTEAPHTDAENWEGGYSCDFEATWGYGMHPSIASRNQEFQQFAINFYKEAALDIHATLKKRD